MARVIEEERTRCPYCGYFVTSHWVVEDGQQKGMMSEPGVDLVASWVYHSECWDKLVEEHPP